MTDTRNVIVIGSGPAGYTAALYAARANLTPLVLKGLDAGGQLMLTTDVENYPGFVDGILGPELMEQMEKQAERFGAEILPVHVTRVDLSSRPFGVWAGDQEWRSQDAHRRHRGQREVAGRPRRGEAPWPRRQRLRHVRRLLLPRPRAGRGGRWRHGDGGGHVPDEVRQQGDDRAPPRRVPRLPIMVDRALANPKIEVIWDTVVDEILGDDAVTGVTLRHVGTGEQREFRTDGVFMAIGHTPNTKLFEGQLELQDGYILVEEPRTTTNVDGVFAAGDVTDTIYRQAVTAAGQGCKAAIDAERFLEAEAHAAG